LQCPRGELTDTILLATMASGVKKIDKYLYIIKGKGSPYSITERRVPELIPVLGSQPAGDVES